MSQPRITVVGSNMVDLITYVDRMPNDGETITAPRFDMGFGGKGANQAVAASLLGAEVHMVSKVGDDLFGPNTKRNFEERGIDIRHVGTASGVSSGVAPIFVDPNSNNRILIVKGANDRLLPEDVMKAQDVILASDLVVMQLEVPLDTVYFTVQLCAGHGIRTILNPAPADPNLDLNRVERVDVLAPNESELHAITGMPVGSLDEVRAAGRSLVDRGFKTVIVTIGERGSLLLTGDAEYLCEAHRVDSVDSTGAGDAFIGCFAVYYVETGDIRAAMDRANKYAALSTMVPGTQKSFADRPSFEAKTGRG